MRKIHRGLLACLATSLLLTACGGGGGGGGNAQDNSTEPTSPPDPTPAETFTLSGTVSTSASQSVDSDTNDGDPDFTISNSEPALAQAIPNPVTLGGYVNQPNTGAPGRSQQSGDIDDFFRVDLLAGQRITMLVADFQQADADLYLYSAEGIQVGNSLNIGEVESLLVPEDGTYFVRVHAFEGATNYILAIGDSNTATQVASQEYTIVPWQAVVTYKEDARQPDTDVQSEEITRRLGMEQRAGGHGRGRLMALNRRQNNAMQMNSSLAGAGQNFGAITDPDLRARWETMMAIKTLRKDPRVRHVEPNYQVHALTTPNDEAYPLQWHYPLIGLPDAWETTTGNPDVIVAVVDTGILLGHPDLAGQLVSGYDFVSDPDNAQDGDGIDPNPQDPGSSFSGDRESFHGTHVSGTVAARGNNRLGVAGSAYTSRVMPVRALGVGGGGTSYDVDQAVRYAAGLPNDSGTVPQKRADVINLSLGGAPFSQATQDLYGEVRAAGVIVVAAAGNQASLAPVYPASYSGVISVSAVDAQRRLAPYSNTGLGVDVAAPGGNNSVDLNGDGYPDGVLSTDGNLSEGRLNYTYSFTSGTSMAAPHVAGVLALMKSVNPSLTPDDIDALLATGALSDDLGAPGRDNLFGHGIINAQRSVLAALEASGNSPADNPRLTASASSLNFGSNSATLVLVLRNGGKGDLELLDLSASEPWLHVDAINVDAAGLGEYDVTVDRANLPPGVYAADITAQSSINNLVIRVLVSVGGADTGTGVGIVYILLYDPLLDEVIDQSTPINNGTDYPFRFAGVPAGNYEIRAGTDTDNDLFICDGGEACGAWLTIDQPIGIDVKGNLDNLNFPVEYQVSLPTINSVGQSSVTEGIRRTAGTAHTYNIKQRLPIKN